MKNLHNSIAKKYFSEFYIGIMNISPTNKITPQKLFEHVSKGKYPKYEYNASQDQNLCELEELKQKYLQTLSVEDKKALLLKEREIIYEELEHPELTLARNYDNVTCLVYDLNAIGDKLLPTLKTLNFSALQRIEGTLLSMFGKQLEQESYGNAVPQEKIFSLLKDGVADIKNDDNEVFLSECISNIFGYINKINPFSKEKEAEFNKLFSKKNDLLSEEVIAFDKLHDMFIGAKYNDTKVIKQVNKLLESADTDLETRQLALLAAGKFKSKENFESVKKVALDLNEKSPIARQNAIQSVALYVRKNPDGVKEILEKIKDEKSEFSPLARILLDKISGNYHGQVDRELNYDFYNMGTAPSVRKKLNGFTLVDAKLNRQHLNKVDLGAMPFANIFKNTEITVTDDTVTKYLKEEVGQRNIVAPCYPNSGYFMDSIDGICTQKGHSIINSKTIEETNNTVSHELGHSLNFLFEDKRAQKKLNTIYNRALENGNSLDYFSELDSFEYFAQGCEAYASIYKPHEDLLSCIDYSNCNCNTRYKLMEKDSELYKFVKSMLERYNAQNQ